MASVLQVITLDRQCTKAQYVHSYIAETVSKVTYRFMSSHK